MFRRLSTGEVVDPEFTRFRFPTYFFYDVLRGLDYLRHAGVEPDERTAGAVELVAAKQDADGRWPLENRARSRPLDPEAEDPGVVHLELDEGESKPSRWNTLRALRVLRWAEGGASSQAAPAN
jgi:hypothetical protein